MAKLTDEEMAKARQKANESVKRSYRIKIDGGPPSHIPPDEPKGIIKVKSPWKGNGELAQVIEFPGKKKESPDDAKDTQN